MVHRGLVVIQTMSYGCQKLDGVHEKPMTSAFPVGHHMLSIYYFPSPTVPIIAGVLYFSVEGIW